MNSKLKDRIYKVPKNVTDFLKSQQPIEGLKRNENLLKTGTVTYGQLKRILHDIKKLNKMTDFRKYNYYGGDLMLNWAINLLKTERGLINDKEDAERIANDIGGLTGERKSPTRQKKKNSFSVGIKMRPPTNLLKSNSSNFSFASLFSPKATKLFEDNKENHEYIRLEEEIKRIKKLML